MGISGSNPGFSYLSDLSTSFLPLWRWCLNISLHTKVAMLSDAALAGTPAEHQALPFAQPAQTLLSF